MIVLAILGRINFRFLNNNDLMIYVAQLAFLGPFGNPSLIGTMKKWGLS